MNKTLRGELKVWYTILCIVLSVVVATTETRAQEPSHEFSSQEHSYMEQLSVDEGLPHTDVSAIVQDYDGYIYIGTSSGLCRYDGNSLTVWDISNSILQSSRIRSLRLIGNLLYIGTENGGLTIFDTDNDRFIKTLKVPTNFVNCIFPSSDGVAVWLCTNDGISLLSGDNDGYSLSSWSFGCVCSCGWHIGGGDEVIVGTNVGIGTFNPEEGLRIVRSGIYATSALEIGQGRIVMAAYEGCFVYDPSSLERPPAADSGSSGDGIGNAYGKGAHKGSGTKVDYLRRINSLDSRSVCPDGEGGFFVWSGHKGVLHYDSQFNNIDALIPWNSAAQTSEIDVSSLMLDRSKVLWIGTNGSGCFRSSMMNRAFGLWEPFRDKGDHQLVTMYADSHDRLWVTSRDGSVAILDNGRLTGLHRPSLGIFSEMPVSAVYESPDGAVWLGSWDYGVGVIPPSDVENACKGRPFRLRRPSGLPTRLSIYKFAEDRFGSMWMTTAAGVWRSRCGSMDGQGYMTTEWDCLRHEKRDVHTLSDDFTTDIAVDGDVVWIGTRTGLNRTVCSNDGKIARIDRVHIRKEDSAGEFVSFIRRSADDSLWVGVLGLGVAKLTGYFDAEDSEGYCNDMKRQDGTDSGKQTEESATLFRIYDKSICPGFPNNEFESVQEDSDGNLWMGGLGLVCFNPKTLEVKSFTRKNGLQSNAFKIWDSARLKDGRMAFGGINGFNLFRPESISDNPVRPVVCLTGLKVNGEDITTASAESETSSKTSASHTPGTKHKSADSGKPLRKRRSIVLSHDMNNLVFTFSSMHYVLPERNCYCYIMRGLDETAHETTGKNPSASYLNMRPGRYRFEVYGTNSDGLRSETPAGIDIRIRPPWYASAEAIICYAIILILSTAGIIVYIRRRSELEHRREIDEKLREEEMERNQNELKFHTDFLHEIRTPLTLITTPVEELLRNPNLGKTTLNRLQLVDQSAKILSKHIESITDLRKYDNGVVRLHVVAIDFSRFVEEICLLFEPVAKAKGYEFSIETTALGENVYVDKNSMEKVILNLMSNAVKYSPERGGKIDVKVSETTDEDGRKGAELAVSNLGIGILPEDLPYIFDRFRQGKNNDRGGMGIGLSLSRSTVLAHSGQISAESVPGGVTTFRVFLPYGCSQFPPEYIDKDYENSDHLSNYDSIAEFRDRAVNSTLSEGVEREHMVLIADDSSELREYLVQLLSSKYNIITATDGEEGYEKTISEQPDLVLTDVVMPKVNGLELCRKIKENPYTSHIPVILISARDLPAYKMEGYNMLTDDYITKPFHADLLLSRIDNLIRQRECMRQSFRTSINLEPSAVTATPVDEKFIRNCIENIEEHISDAEYGVDDLCRNIGYSRPQFYRKIKSITGLSAIQFMRTVRLKRAAQLLSSGAGMSVAEVMYAVGFNNITYFSKIFSAEFGVSPKDYKGEEGGGAKADSDKFVKE